MVVALCVVAGSAAHGQSFDLFSSVMQSGPAVAHDENSGRFLVVGLHNDRPAGRTVSRIGDTIALGDVELLVRSSGSDPAVAFAAAADLYFVSAIQCRSFGTVVRPDGAPVILQRSGLDLRIGRPGCDTRAVRVLFSEPLERWVVLASVDDARIDGAMMSTDGVVEVMGRELFHDVEFGDIGDFDVASHPDDAGFFLAWGRAGRLFGQRIALDTNTVGPRMVLADGAANRNVTIGRARDRGYLAVWERSQRIWARRVDGEVLGPVHEITDGPGEAFAPVLAYLPTEDSFLVVWTQRDFDEDLMARWLDGSGRPTGPSFAVASGVGHQLTFDHNALACSSDTAECLVAWNHGEPGRPATSIRGRFLERP